MAKLPTKVLADGTVKSVSIADWAKENLSGDELALFEKHFEEHSAAMEKYQADGHATIEEIVEDGVIVGWHEVHAGTANPPEVPPEVEHIYLNYFIE